MRVLGPFYPDGRPREYAIRDGLVYKRTEGEKMWREYAKEYRMSFVEGLIAERDRLRDLEAAVDGCEIGCASCGATLSFVVDGEGEIGTDEFEFTFGTVYDPAKQPKDRSDASRGSEDENP